VSAKVAALDGAVGFEYRTMVLTRFAGDGEADTLEAAALALEAAQHADNLAVQVNERPPLCPD